VTLLGVPGEASAWPAVQSDAGPGDRAGSILLLRPGRCDGCGACVPACPASCLSVAFDRALTIDEAPCIECFACVEACPAGALAPVAHERPTTMCPDLRRPRGFLPALSASATPPPAATISPRAARRAMRPFRVLGLAISTMQENGAALLRDGVLAGAVEEERLNRVKHYGFAVPGRPHRTICNDLSIRLEEAFAWRSVRYLLETEGIGLDDVDCIAVNGIPGRFRRSYSLGDASRPPVILRSGRYVFVPHHLAHAASAFYPSGMRDAMVLTVDGRGDRETAAFFRACDGRIERVFDVLSQDDSSVGGVYETVTRVLGFGSHGQGTTMALAVMGEPTFDLSACMSIERHDRHRLHERVAAETLARHARTRFDPLLPVHRNLAASVQRALEDAVITLIDEGREGEPVRRLCLAGGVALNCQMNTRIRRHFGVEEMFVQPAAHDAGTAIGAAMEAHRLVTGEAPSWRMTHALLGPGYDAAAIDEAVAAFGLESRQVDDAAGEVAALLADGKVVAWDQGRLEIGPRALGGRSILANPADPSLVRRLNAAKGREEWRPFAPSILAGREAGWLDDAAGNPFMLFVSTVNPDRRNRVPAIVHADGTTRPQSVTEEAVPAYHRMLTAFERLTGLPLVLNTSFNTADEPIVCSPRDAVDSFVKLDADWLAIGDRLVSRPGARTATTVAAARPAPTPTPLEDGGGKFTRLLLRLGTRCNSACAHCTVRDLAHLPDRTTAEALAELEAGRRRGCDEVVFLRGEALIRRDFPDLVRAARAMGYRHVQAQTNGRMLAYPKLAAALVRRGVDFFEVSLYGASAATHDEIARSDGAFDQTVAGIRSLAEAGAGLMVSVPILVANYLELARVADLVADLGVPRLHLAMTRPVWLPDLGRFDTAPTVRISRAAPRIREAVRAGRDRGLRVTTEGVVLCHLDPDLWDSAELPGEVAGQVVSDLTGTFAAGDVRSSSRPLPAPCASCAVNRRCPRPWAANLLLLGDGELLPM
jgi:carbamoyltransferase